MPTVLSLPFLISLLPAAVAFTLWPLVRTRQDRVRRWERLVLPMYVVLAAALALGKGGDADAMLANFVWITVNLVSGALFGGAVARRLGRKEIHEVSLGMFAGASVLVFFSVGLLQVTRLLERYWH